MYKRQIFVVALAGFLFSFTPKTLLEKNPDRGVYLVFGKTDESSSFEYTVDKAEKVERRLIPLLQDEKEPYQKLIMRVPGFGRSATTYNTFIIIALLDEWKNREKSSQTVLREAIGQVVSVPETFAFPISPQGIRVSSYNKPVQMVIYGSSYEELEEVQKKVINCTGTLLHTNLGRSQIDTDYSGESTNIEFDLFNQKRGIRNEFLNELMNLLLNSEDSCFVNNNASSLYITLKTLKDEFEINSVIISRGEIIEIGGSYRLPEIIQETGLNMIEIGTTNKTRLKDYQKALDKNDKSLILKVHRSNYSIEGFTEDVDIKELRSLANKNNALLLHCLLYTSPSPRD